MSETVSISTLDGGGRFDCYVARPAQAPRAAIVMIQEIFGVNAGIRRKCDRLAHEGYLALAPDLFWRIEPGVELDPDVPEQFQTALGLMGLVSLGWMWAKMSTASAALAGGEDGAYHQTKIATARFYAQRALGAASALRREVEAGAETVMALEIDAF